MSVFLLMLLKPARRTAAPPGAIRRDALEGGNRLVNPALFIAQFPKDSFEIHTIS